jgi:hypothetical protein
MDIKRAFSCEGVYTERRYGGGWIYQYPVDN